MCGDGTIEFGQVALQALACDGCIGVCTGLDAWGQCDNVVAAVGRGKDAAQGAGLLGCGAVAPQCVRQAEAVGHSTVDGGYAAGARGCGSCRGIGLSCGEEAHLRSGYRHLRWG